MIKGMNVYRQNCELRKPNSFQFSFYIRHIAHNMSSLRELRLTNFDKLNAAVAKTRAATEKQVREHIRNGAKYLMVENGKIVIAKR